MNKIIKEAKDINDEFNFYNTIANSLPKPKDGPLKGIPISVKDAICVKNMESRAGSNILDSYRPVFNATIVTKIINAGGVIVGKTSQDAFGFGSFNVNVGINMKIPQNPYDKSRSCGGSSGGACGIVSKSKYQSMGIAESTGGSLVAPAAFCGIYGLCPTYGAVSRYGLMDYASSLDKIGPVGKTPQDVKKLFNVIKGHDPKDSTSLKTPPKNSKPSKKPTKLRIGVIKDYMDNKKNPEITNTILDKLAHSKIETKEVSLPLTTKFSLPAYYILAMSEASTNLAMYCGIRYGKENKLNENFTDYFKNIRSTYFNTETKRRILLGTFARMSGFRDAYYIKAAKVRTLIINEYKKIFKDYDIIISPTMPTIAPRFEDIQKLTPLQHYMMDILTIGPNLAGMPHMNIPIGFSKNMPIGMMTIANHLHENTLLDFAKDFTIKNKYQSNPQTRNDEVNT